MCHDGRAGPLEGPKSAEELFEEALQKKRREARLYDGGYNSLMEESFR